MPVRVSIDPLAWESDFFRCATARLTLDGDVPLAEALQQPYTLWQVKVPAQDSAAIDALSQHGFQLVEGEADVDAGAAGVPGPPHPAVRAHGLGQRRVVGRGHHVDRAAHHPALDDPAAGQGVGEVGAAEPGQSRPQADVGRRAVLRLQPAHPLDRPIARFVPESAHNAQVPPHNCRRPVRPTR